MQLTRFWSITFLTVGIGLPAYAEQPTNEQLMEELRQLKAEVAQLKATTRPTADVRDSRDADAAVTKVMREDVLRDAQTRSSLPSSDEPFTGGWKGGKFILQSENGDFLLAPSLQVQPRYVAAWREGAGAHGGDDLSSGFEIRRFKVDFSGNVFSPDLTYDFQWAFSRSTGTPTLEDAWARYRLSDDWSLRAGQFKDPLSHEQLVSSRRFLTADRSYLNEIMIVGDNYVQGAGLGYGSKGPLQAEVAFTDGARSGNTDFLNHTAGSTRPDFGIAGRMQYKLFGDWKQYDDFSAIGNTQNLLVAGLGGDWSQISGADQLLHTADLQYENTHGLGLYGAYVGRYTAANTVTGAAQHQTYDWGFLAQAGYMLDKKHWEVFGRYDQINLDQASEKVNEFTVGVNYFFEGHSAKLTLDATYLPDGAPVDAQSIGIISSPGKEVIVRIQFQLLI